jgi:hypothetical protein
MRELKHFQAGWPEQPQRLDATTCRESRNQPKGSEFVFICRDVCMEKENLQDY